MVYTSYSGDKMNERILVRKRFLAFIIDMFIVTIMISLIFVGQDTRINDKREEELIKLVNDYGSEKITTDEYINKYSNIIYETNYDNYNENLIYLVVTIGYFLVFQYLNGGASIGKKLVKVRIVDKDKKNVSIWQLLIRVCLINEMLPMILLLLLVKFASGINFFIGYGFVSLMENLIVIVCGLMMIIRKDGRGLHDIISNSQVIIDEKY